MKIVLALTLKDIVGLLVIFLFLAFIGYLYISAKVEDFQEKRRKKKLKKEERKNERCNKNI